MVKSAAGRTVAQFVKSAQKASACQSALAGFVAAACVLTSPVVKRVNIVPRARCARRGIVYLPAVKEILAVVASVANLAAEKTKIAGRVEFAGMEFA
jgi:hypothetical protein